MYHINETNEVRRQEWEIKQLLHGNRLANSGKLRLDGDAL